MSQDNKTYIDLPKETDPKYNVSDPTGMAIFIEDYNKAREHNLQIALENNDIDNIVEYMPKAYNEHKIGDKTLGELVANNWNEFGGSEFFSKFINDENVVNNIVKYKSIEDLLNDFKTYQEENGLINHEIAQYSLAMSTMMKGLEQNLKWLINNFNNNRAVYASYVKFSVGNSLSDMLTLVDTSSTDPIKNCLLSFNHKFSGAGQCNEFTLKLAFKPTERTSWVINYIDKILMGVVDITTANGDDSASHSNLKESNDICINCEYQYGYGSLDNLSELYSGMILDFQCDLSNGYFIYTINGIGGVYAAKERKLSAKPEYLKDDKGSEITNPLLYLKNIVDIEFKNIYKVKFLNDCENDVVSMGDTSTEAGSITVDNFNNFQQKTIFQIISDVLNSIVVPAEQQYFTSGGNQVLVPTAKTTYSYYVTTKPFDEDDKGGTILIYKNPNINSVNAEDRDIKPHIDLSFNWYAPMGGVDYLIKRWSPKYDGKILMAMGMSIKSKLKDLTGYNMDDDGNIIKQISFEAPRIGGNQNGTTQVRCQEFSQWSKATQYPYAADLEILGCPAEVPMTGIIQVKAWIYDQEHHSSGNYMILGKEDDISNSGFITKFNLFKITPGYDEIINVNVETDTPPDPTINAVSFDSAKGKYIENELKDAYNNLQNADPFKKVNANVTLDDIKGLEKHVDELYSTNPVEWQNPSQSLQQAQEEAKKKMLNSINLFLKVGNYDTNEVSEAYNILFRWEFNNLDTKDSNKLKAYDTFRTVFNNQDSNENKAKLALWYLDNKTSDVWNYNNKMQLELEKLGFDPY